MGVELPPISRCLNFQSVKIIYCGLGETAEPLCASKCDMELLFPLSSRSPQKPGEWSRPDRSRPQSRKEREQAASGDSVISERWPGFLNPGQVGENEDVECVAGAHNMEGVKTETGIKNTQNTCEAQTRKLTEFPSLDLPDKKATVTRPRRLFLLPKKHLTAPK